VLVPEVDAPNLNLLNIVPAASADSEDSMSDSEDETNYMPHSEDSGEDSQVLELRKHASKIQERMRDTRIGRYESSAVPIDLVANMEDMIWEVEKD
jgi:hypothetical protein